MDTRGFQDPRFSLPERNPSPPQPTASALSDDQVTTPGVEFASNVALASTSVPKPMPSPTRPAPKISPRIAPSVHSAEEWERQRSTFTQLYIVEDMPLKEVINIMEKEYKFRATPKQYKRRIEQWKLDKNIKENDMKVILRKNLKRKREGKESEFSISGRDVEPQKIQRFAQRNKLTEDSILEFDVGMAILI
ncbi:hypothetical protein NHQ30_011430 [Ciborinia camelliae]|nr:hypothetical protein NHQ30_011430 [Ciborinia camelliae]